MKRNLYHENWIIHHLWFIYSILPGLPDDCNDQMPGCEYCITFMPMDDQGGGSADLVPLVEETSTQPGEEGYYYYE